MTAEEFNHARKPFYLHPETLLVKFPSARYMDSTHATWFNDDGIPFLHTVRGYYMKDFIYLYVNDFEIPDIAMKVCCYLFEYFPRIKWIGLGCDRGKPGEVWPPKLKVSRGDIQET